MQSGELNLQRDPPRLTPVDSGNERFFMSEKAEQGRLSIVDYWRVIRRYKWSIVAIALIAGIVGTLHAISQTSIYRAQARLWVKLNQPNISYVQQFESTPLYWLYFQTQADIIKSRAVAEKVISRLGLDEIRTTNIAWAEDDETATGSSLASQLRGWLNEVKSWLPEELRSPAPVELDEEGRYAALVSRILQGVSVSGGTESEILVISYSSSDPRNAAEMANAFAEGYLQFAGESRSSNMQQATSWLASRIEELREKAIAAEETLREFQARESLVDTGNREQIISAKLGTLTAELVKAQSRRSEAEARYAQIKSAAERENNFEAIAGAMDSITVLEAHRAQIERERRVAELSERYGHKHPKMISAKAELQEARRRLKAETTKAIDVAREDFELAAAQERQFRDLIKQQQDEMRKVSGKVFELKQLESDVQANRELYQTYLNRFNEADIADEYDTPNARIIDRASVPAAPFRPDRKQIILISIVIGLGVGVLMAFVREQLNNTFKTREEIEEKLGLPVIGMLPRDKGRLSSKGSIERRVMADPRSSFAEAINDVRTAILFSHVDTPSKIVLVTSAVPGEGKTTLASNLALAFSRRGRTLLIDADLRKGRLHHVTHLHDHLGLTDMIAGGCKPKEAIVPDPEAENLFLLMPGTTPPNPLEIVSSNRFSEDLARLRSTFDYIIIDATPLLPVSDSIVLARLADAVVLAIKSAATHRDVVIESVKRLESARVKPLGVVLQQVDMQKIRSYGRRYAATYNGYYDYHQQTSG